MENNKLITSTNIQIDAKGPSRKVSTKVKNWLTNSLVPAFKNVCQNQVIPAIESMCRGLARCARVSWVAILAFAILWVMCQNGLLDDLPNLRWLVQASGNLIDWVFGLIRSIISWIGKIDSPMQEWFKGIMLV